jgi:hypothetical protein
VSKVTSNTDIWFKRVSKYIDESDASIVRELSLEEVLAIYDECLMPGSSSNRKKLSYHFISQQLLTETLLPLEAQAPYILVEDENLFKIGLAISAAAVPVRHVHGCETNSRL